MNLRLLEEFVRSRMGAEGTGHDWHHAARVRKTALSLARREGDCDLEVVEASALLHDVCDRKLHPEPAQGMREIAARLEVAGASAAQASHVMEIIAGISYKGAGVQTPMGTLEGKVVQDADRLDALGAIGIARCFAYGGSKGRSLYDPDDGPRLHANAEAYFQGQGSSLNHFHEKLLLLKDRMQTESGRRAAEGRHRFMEEYLERFLAEWDGQDGD